MNIGIVTTWFPSGAGSVSKSYEHALKSAHKVFIYARGGMPAKADPDWNHPNVTWAPPHPCTTGIYTQHFTRWVKRYSINTVIFNEQRYWNAVIVSRKLGLLVGGYVDYYTADTVPFFNLYDFLMCNTQRHYQVFREHPQCSYIPWGTDVSVFKPAQAHLQRPITFIISAGWGGFYAKSTPWLDRRGAGLTMRTFRKVHGDCKLIVLSQVPLEDCPSIWQKHAKDDKRIEFRVGTFDPEIYTQGDVYVYPSRLDGIGLTLPEALSSGLPAITTNSAPMNEFVQDGYNGILVNVKEYRGRPDGYYWPESICDEDELAKAFQFYLNNPEKVLSHGANARAFAEEHLSWDKNSDFLAEWVAAQKRLSDRSGVTLEKLSEEAKIYDRNHNPMPLRKLLISLRGLSRWISNHLFWYFALGKYSQINKSIEIK